MTAYAHSEGTLLPLAALWPDVDAWLRESNKFPAAKIAAIARRMQGGDILPPVFVRLRHDGKFHVIDGAHRIAASLALGFSHIPARHDAEGMTPRQLSYVNRATALLPAAARAPFQRSVADLLAHVLHPLDDRDVLDLLRPLLAEHGISISAVLPTPTREFARYERKHRHASHPVL